MSLSFCDFSCWTAKEAVCRCKCNGANHGIANRRPGTQEKIAPGLFDEVIE